MLVKLGEAQLLTEASILSTDSITSDPELVERFKKMASNLKKIAPKAEDFLYFSAIMMHAAEASALDQDGELKKDARGKPVKVGWDKKGESWKWTSSDSNLKPYKNCNADIFPEEELLKAYKKWIGKPLCVDHKSSSVDAIRGVIIDTYYDHKFKRVIALCALDKVNYPDLARKVSAGYATSVSMGTGVGKAVCTDCGRVAKIADDFCNHMKSKSCYGEINLDLSPIELSLVFNGADPKAKVKHIIAAAQSINEYIEKKAAKLPELSEDQMAQLRDELKNISNSVKDLMKLTKSSPEESSEDEEECQYCGDLNYSNDCAYCSDSQNNEDASFSLGANNGPGVDRTPDPYAINSSATDTGIAGGPTYIPMGAFASLDVEGMLKTLTASVNELAEKIDNISKVNMIKSAASDPEGLAKRELNLYLHGLQTGLGEIPANFKQSNNSERNMKKQSYFQGGGGVNEPTPGEVKYEKDPKNEDLRNNEDRQMTNITETGSKGMFPGDAELKEKISRAGLEERSLRRAAALKAVKAALRKESYMQGGEDPLLREDLAPNSKKYEHDPLNEKARKEDKQVNGKKPFPEVGEVTGLFPGDKEVKEKHSRASVKLRFVKAAKLNGQEDRANSGWQVFADNKLVFAASVKELSGGKVDALYDVIATRDFGSKMLEKVKSVGIQKAASIYKSAQDLGAVPPGPPAAPSGMSTQPVDTASMAPMAEMPETPEATEPKDPKESVADLVQKTEDELSTLTTTFSDLKEGVNGLVGEKEEVGKVGVEVEKAASGETAALFKMRRELNRGLIEGMTKAASEIQSVAGELEVLHDVLSDGVSNSNVPYVTEVVESTMQDSKEALANAYKIMGAFARYARGTDSLIKRATAEYQIRKTAEFSGLDEVLDGDLDVEDLKDLESADDLSLVADESLVEDEQDADSTSVEVQSGGQKMDVKPGQKDVKPGQEVKPGAPMVVSKQASVDLTTKAGRAMARTKLAAAAEVEFNKIIDEAHPDGSPEIETGSKVKDDLAVVETIIDRHKAIMEVAKAPVSVRKEAEQIQELVSQGKLAASDVDRLASYGGDPAAIKYWKELYGEAGKEGKEFAAALTKDHVQKKASEDMESYKVKIARAYDLANEMVRKGIVENEQNAVNAQVQEIMSWNDEGFDSVKRMVSKQTVKKTASVAMPQVTGYSENSQKAESGNLYEEFVKAFSTKRY